MSAYTPPRKYLRGLSVEKAELYGKPHLGAVYIGDSLSAKWQRIACRCVCCGRVATNCHHVIPRGCGKSFKLHGYTLQSSLFALCGSGTTGCHGEFHAAKLKATWVWDSDEYARAWWDGHFLKKYGAYSSELFNFGHWIIDGKHGQYVRDGAWPFGANGYYSGSMDSDV